MVASYETSIDELFQLLEQDVIDYSTAALHYTAQESLKAIAKAWANEIIKMLTDKSLYPPLEESTIERRIQRAMNIKGPDYPLLETGQWMTFIEFRIAQYGDRYTLEVGVFDDTTQIGHTGNMSPSWFATVSEYGNRHMPARYPFVTSEMRIGEKTRNIIVDTWISLSKELKNGYALDRRINVAIKRGTADFSNFRAIGHIIIVGNKFKFKWDG